MWLKSENKFIEKKIHFLDKTLTVILLITLLLYLHKSLNYCFVIACQPTVTLPSSKIKDDANITNEPRYMYTYLKLLDIARLINTVLYEIQTCKKQ